MNRLTSLLADERPFDADDSLCYRGVLAGHGYLDVAR